MSESVHSFSQEVIRHFLLCTFESTCSLSDFCRECKRYEHAKFMLPDHQDFYYQQKSLFILRSFGRELEEKLSAGSSVKKFSYANEMTLYQLVPQELHGTFFFKCIQSLLKVDLKKFDNNQIRSCIFMALHVEQNLHWAEKFSSVMRKCQEKLDGLKREVQQEPINESDSFECLFVKVAELVE